MFHKCIDKEHIKKIFRKVALHLHPDHGGDNYLFDLLIESRDNALESFGKNDSDRTEKYRYEKQYEDIKINDKKLCILGDLWIYSRNHKKFDVSFLASICEYLDDHGHITYSQYNATLKVYNSFRVEKWFEENPQ